MTDELEAAVEQAIGECGGDMRAAVRALVVANAFLAGEVERLDATISQGFVRGMLRQGRLPGPQNDEQTGGEGDDQESTEQPPDADAQPLARRQ